MICNAVLVIPVYCGSFLSKSITLISANPAKASFQTTRRIAHFGKPGDEGARALFCLGKEDGSMTNAAREKFSTILRGGALAAGLVLLALLPVPLRAQDCLTCHSDASMTDSAGHSIAVDGQKFSSSIHGSLQCSNCHADIKGYPHPDKIAPVDCKV